MTIRAIGLILPAFTTAQLAALVAQYGPAGTVEVGAIALGALVRNTTTGALNVFDGTAFVAGTDYTP